MAFAPLLRTAAVLVCAAAAVSLWALPAQAKTSSPEKWGAAFCGSLSDWGTEIGNGATEIQQSLTGTTVTPEQGKATIIGFLGDFVDTTSDFYAGVKKAGTPDTTNGAKIQKTILAGIKGIETRLGDMQDTAANLPTTNPTSFQTAVNALTAAFDTVSTPFDQAMDKVSNLDKGDELSGKLQKVKACKALFG